MYACCNMHDEAIKLESQTIQGSISAPKFLPLAAPSSNRAGAGAVYPSSFLELLVSACFRLKLSAFERLYRQCEAVETGLSRFQFNRPIALP